MPNPYTEFTKRLKLLISKNPELITMTLSNIFTMRLIGNKTHGDLAEIAISEFINQYMYDYASKHVGKDLYRAKIRKKTFWSSMKLPITRCRSHSRLMETDLCNYRPTNLSPCFRDLWVKILRK